MLVMSSSLALFLSRYQDTGYPGTNTTCRLAEVPDTAVSDDSGQVLPPRIQTILDGLNPIPASVVTERFDILAWNAAYAVLIPRTAEDPAAERNTLLYCFTRSECCSAIENRADQRAAMVAQLRAAYGHHVGDPAWTGFIRRMEAASPEFAAMWATQDVAQPAYHAKVFRHPLYPRLEMTSTSFAVQTAPGARMVVYTPDNEVTRAAMERLAADRSSIISRAGPPIRRGPANSCRCKGTA